MHEWALAEAVILTSADIAKVKNIERIAIVRIRLGELQRIDRECFGFAFEEIVKSYGTLFDKTTLSFETEPVRLRCRVCAHCWGLSDAGLDEHSAEAIHFVPEISHAYMKCPLCGSSDFDIVEGRGIALSGIVENNGDD